MKTLLLIVAGLAPAAALRFWILRRPISRGAAVGTCFGILCGLAILASTVVERGFHGEEAQETLGPIPILAALVKQMVIVSLPVLAFSYFILRRPGDEE